jgi:dihydropteroate synthase
MPSGCTIRIMGILNITPDSFSDGGQFHSLAAATAQADELIAAGVDILDVGGESTRPYADPVSTEEELRRTIPVIRAIREKHDLPISIDTTKAAVAREALAAGASIINDISALRKDPEMLELVRETTVPVIIMHMRGNPANMQDNPVYTDVVEDVLDFFREQLHWLGAQGVNTDRIIVDPGIGFGKNLHHNLSLLKNLQKLRTLGTRVLLGHSRKKFLGLLTGLAVEERDLPTAVISALAVQQGVDIIRVHNVAATRHALQVAEAVYHAV